MLEFLYCIFMFLVTTAFYVYIPACFDTVTLICEFRLLFETLTLSIIFNSQCSNFHIADLECQRFLWQDLCTGIQTFDHLWNGYYRGGLYFNKLNISRWFSFFLFVFLCLFANEYDSFGCFYLFLYFSVWLFFKSRYDHFFSLSFSLSLSLS